MKPLKNLLLLICAIFILSSCTKEEEMKMDACEFEVLITPFCSFNPKVAKESPIPVGILKDGENIFGENYDFSWSSDPTFKGSAISVRYIDLPLSVTVTDLSTNCVAEATLNQDYWD